jgi:putative intracellular protease/amidase
MKSSSLFRFLLVMVSILTPITPSFARGFKPPPNSILLIVPQRNYHFQEYTDIKETLVKAGYSVVTASPSLAEPVLAEMGTGSRDAGEFRAEMKYSDVSVKDFSAIVFIGGMGSSGALFEFQGAYHSNELNAKEGKADHMNRLHWQFLNAQKPIAAIGRATSILAWTRIPNGNTVMSGVSNKNIAAFDGFVPAMTYQGKAYKEGELPMSWHIEVNGGKVKDPATMGDPAVDTDNVVIDRPYITAPNSKSAKKLAEVLIDQLKKSQSKPAP